MIGEHDQHGHDSTTANQHGPDYPYRYNWDDPALDAKRGGQPAPCDACRTSPWWILAKVPAGRRPLCSRCFTAQSMKRIEVIR